MKKIYLMTATAICVVLSSQVAVAQINAKKIFNSHCQMCHAFDKKKIGPAFKDMTADSAVLKEIITNGRNIMPSWKNKLSGAEIDAMVSFIRSKQSGASK